MRIDSMGKNGDEEVPTDDLNDLKECFYLLKKYLGHWVVCHEEAQQKKENDKEDWEMHLAQYTSDAYVAEYGVEFEFEWM